ncbi:hypothetical protein M8818_007462 [Zalaria obscura]|uniref:Uncharacterized protein n=1 Tax=Zalaria obscura TaxID=2024903 RepID=A0ACC3S3R8_9PEZI
MLPRYCMEVKIHGRAASRPRVLAMQSPEDAKRPVTFWSFSGLFALSDFESNTRLSHETEHGCSHGMEFTSIYAALAYMISSLSKQSQVGSGFAPQRASCDRACFRPVFALSTAWSQWD